jgi:soluble lytic murein transglycosylase-like protein
MLPMFVSDVPLHCINQAAVEFHVPAKLIISILNIERGKVGQAVKNSNGTYDLGPMQINTSWLPELRRYSISREAVQYDPCINVKVGAWILAKSIAEEKSLLKGVGDYHSHTFKHNYPYSQKVRINFTTVNYILKREV